jgi:hypothetical protein
MPFFYTYLTPFPIPKKCPRNILISSSNLQPTKGQNLYSKMFIDKKIRKFVTTQLKVVMSELKVVMQASTVLSLWVYSSLIKTVMTIYASVGGYFSISLSL